MLFLLLCSYGNMIISLFLLRPAARCGNGEGKRMFRKIIENKTLEGNSTRRCAECLRHNALATRHTTVHGILYCLLETVRLLTVGEILRSSHGNDISYNLKKDWRKMSVSLSGLLSSTFLDRNNFLEPISANARRSLVGLTPRWARPSA